MFRRCTMVFGVVSASSSSACGTGRRVQHGRHAQPNDGSWTGEASLEFVTVGDPGNAADTTVTGDGTSGYGSVPYTYQMGKYDVTVGQYCQFLNAVAKTDTYGLYNLHRLRPMATDFPTFGITQSGSSGSYSYSVTGGYSQAANCPMFDVSWGDAARFCNWLQNGQPTGAEGRGHDRDRGVHAQRRDHRCRLDGDNPQRRGHLLHSDRKTNGTRRRITTRQAGRAATGPIRRRATPRRATCFPRRARTTPTFTTLCTGNGYTDPTNYLTPVGAFAASPGPYGTYDMGGDVWQWNEAKLPVRRVVCVAAVGATSTTAPASWPRSTATPATRRTGTATSA